MVLFQISVIHKHNLYRNEGINIMKKTLSPPQTPYYVKMMRIPFITVAFPGGSQQNQQWQLASVQLEASQPGIHNE